MVSPAPIPSVIRFGAFELDAASGELRKSGISLKIQPQPFRVLTLLVEQPGQIVSREEIRRCLWGDNTFVDFELGINFCVKQIRTALSDDAEKPRYIQTLPRRGYRFIGTVATPDAEKPAASIAAPMAGESADAFAGNGGGDPSSHSIHVLPPHLPATQMATGPKWRFGALIIALPVLAILIASTIFYFRGKPKAAQKDTVVLADFTNTTGDPVFDDTLRQGLAVQLEQSPYLHIISEQQIAQTLRLMSLAPNARLTSDVAPQVCARLNAAAAMEGSIAQVGSQYNMILKAVDCVNGGT